MGRKNIFILITALILLIVIAFNFAGKNFIPAEQPVPVIPTEGIQKSDDPVVKTCPAPPGKYLMRSSCPFDSASINGECRVICPISGGKDFNVSCREDSDCDCSRYQNMYTVENFECRCADNRCAIAIPKSEVKNWP